MRWRAFCPSMRASASRPCSPTTTSPPSSTWPAPGWERTRCGRSPLTSSSWCRAAMGEALPWPAPVDLPLVRAPTSGTRRSARPTRTTACRRPWSTSCAGWSPAGRGPAWVPPRRRLAHWSTLHRFRGLEGPQGPRLRTALSPPPGQPPPAWQQERTGRDRGRGQELLAACPFDHRVADLRDRALLLIAFASGGRRRSEVARLWVDDVIREAPIPLDPKDPDSPLVPKLAIRLGRTKTTAAEDDARVVVIGRAAQAVIDWLEAAKIDKGPVFRRIDRWGAAGRAGPRPAKRQRRAEEAMPARRLDPSCSRPRPALRVHDRGRPTRGAAPRGHAPVPAPLGAAGSRATTTRPSSSEGWPCG